jgi:hypothetical protein
MPLSDKQSLARTYAGLLDASLTLQMMCAPEGLAESQMYYEAVGNVNIALRHVKFLLDNAKKREAYHG